MADTRKNAHTVRVPEEGLWEEFEAATAPHSPSVVLREFMAWYVRRPRARLPQRPGSD